MFMFGIMQVSSWNDWARDASPFSSNKCVLSSKSTVRHTVPEAIFKGKGK